MNRLRQLTKRIRNDRALRGVLIYVSLAGAIGLAVSEWLGSRLGPQGTPLLDAVLLALFAGGLIVALLRGAVQRGEDTILALRAETERFRSLTALSADWFWESDPEHRISWLAGGAPMLELLGHGRTFGKRLSEVEGLEFAPDARAAHESMLAARAPFHDLEVTRRDIGGAPRVHLISGEPRLDANGAFLGYRGIGRDITSQRSAEHALAEAKERLELSLEGGNQAFWDFDLDEDTVHLSENWARTLGFEPGAGVARASSLLKRVHPDDQMVVSETFARAVKGETPLYRVEYRVRGEDGEWHWMLSTGRVTGRGTEGWARRISGTVVDIDARVRTEQALGDAEERYRKLVELSPDGVVVHSGGVIEYANPAALQLIGARSAEEAVGLSLERLVHPEELERHRDRQRGDAAAPSVTEFLPRRLRRLDGSEIPVEVVGRSYLERGRTVVQAVIRDVRAERQAKQALADRERRFRDVIETAGEYVWETDPGWRFSFLSDRVEAVLGYSPAELLGRTPRELMPLGESRATEEWFARQAAQGRPFRDFVHRSITKSGRVIWQSVSGVPVLDANGRLKGYRGTGADITARKQAEERIHYLATRDALTGLPNRVLLNDRASHAILTAARSRGQLALLYFDLDRFNLVNDSLGHDAGDALLRAVAERVANTLGREDCLARLGGDEFVLFWEGMKSAQEAAVVAQRVLGALARAFVIEDRSLNVTASVGISVYPGDGRTFADLLKNADAAMYHAKESGRNTFRFFSPALNERAVERLTLENDLRRALARGELLLHYQPVVRGLRGAHRIVGAEALVRWQHPERGLLLPDAFVPLAEECGLIQALGEWTLERVLSQVGAWQRSLPGELWFAINVSAPELAQGEAYVARLRDAMSANRVEGPRLELEVTERVLMSQLGGNVQTLRRLGELGIRVAIDDFGTGYSSLAYLRRLPIDKLKIDRSFLRELDSHAADETIVQTIAAMAKGLGMSVAAEGVETPGQLSRLLALGCEEWQGHHFSIPLEPHAFEALVTQRVAAAG